MDKPRNSGVHNMANARRWIVFQCLQWPTILVAICVLCLPRLLDEPAARAFWFRFTIINKHHIFLSLAMPCLPFPLCSNRFKLVKGSLNELKLTEKLSFILRIGLG